MADTGNGQSLLGRCGRKQRAGAAEENPLQLPLIQLVQQIATESNGTASATGTAGMDVLYRIVEYQRAAVGQFAAQGQMIPFSQFQQSFLADLPQVTGDNQIKVLRAYLQILKMGTYGIVSGRRHSAPHIIGIFYTQIGNRANGTSCNFGAYTAIAD